MAIHWSPPPRPDGRSDARERRRQRLAATRLQRLREQGVSESLLSVVFGQRDPVVDALLEDWGLSAVEWMDDLDEDTADRIGLASIEPQHHGVYATGSRLVMVEGERTRAVTELDVWQALFRTRLELCEGALVDASGRPIDRVLVRARLFELGGPALSAWAAPFLG